MDFIVEYESDLFEAISSAIEARNEPVVLIDCGARIGVVSLKIAKRCGIAVESIIAFEPNPILFECLSNNLGRLGQNNRLLRAAVSDKKDKGRLVALEYDQSPAARYFESDEGEDIDVLSIDDLDIEPGQHLVLKTEVEGLEDAVVAGAMNSPKNAKSFTIALEAHPNAISRTG